jgi:hypothetical protein
MGVEPMTCRLRISHCPAEQGKSVLEWQLTNAQEIDAESVVTFQGSEERFIYV